MIMSRRGGGEAYTHIGTFGAESDGNFQARGRCLRLDLDGGGLYLNTDALVVCALARRMITRVTRRVIQVVQWSRTFKLALSNSHVEI